MSRLLLRKASSYLFLIQMLTFKYVRSLLEIQLGNQANEIVPVRDALPPPPPRAMFNRRLRLRRTIHLSTVKGFGFFFLGRFNLEMVQGAGLV